MATQRYFYGSFALHDGVNYFVTAKDVSLPAYKQTLFQVARFEGVKKTGERVNERVISITMKVVGASRVDLEQKLDALYQALAQRQQRLTLHAEDGRYWIADATTASAKLSAGHIVAADVSLSFTAQQPYAFAAISSAFTYSALALTSNGAGQWTSPISPNPLTIPAGGGNTFARPSITLTNNTAANASTLTAALTSGTVYTALSVAALPAAATSGQVFLLVSGANVQRVTLSANALVGATTISVTSFTANFAYPVGAFCGLDCYLTGFTLTQNPDGQALSVSGLSAQAVGNGDQLIINCDPTTSNGYTVIPSTSGNTPVLFSGSFPLVEPGVTSFTVLVSCSNAPTISFNVTWTARWLS